MNVTCNCCGRDFDPNIEPPGITSLGTFCEECGTDAEAEELAEAEAYANEHCKIYDLPGVEDFDGTEVQYVNKCRHEHSNYEHLLSEDDNRNDPLRYAAIKNRINELICEEAGIDQR